MLKSIQIRILVSFIILMLIIAIDYNITFEVSLLALYLIPLIFFTFQNKIPFIYSIFFSILCSSAWCYVDYKTHHYTRETHLVFNWLTKVIFLLFAAVAVKKYFNEIELKKMISQQRKTLQLVNQQLNTANAELNKFIGMAAHDIRNPVGGIKMMAELLLSKESVPEDLVKLIKMIESAAANSLLILNDTLNISKIESGTISLNKAPYDYITFIKEAILAETYLSDKKNQTINFQSNTDQLIMNFDKSRINQVINNLLTNAIKYSNMNTSIVVSVEYNNDTKEVLTSVKDQGLGIDEKYHATLFAPFTTTSNVPTNNESKTGLGLAIVKKIVELHNGTIHFTSEKGVGSTFYYSLPIE